MKLRQKTLLFFGLSLLSLIGILYTSYSIIFLGSFTELEEKSTRRNVQRIKNALTEEINQLSLKVKDWSAWDETYEFVQSPNQSYIRKNLVPATFSDLQIDFMLFYNRRGDLVFGRWLDPETQNSVEIPPAFQAQAKLGEILFQPLQTQQEIKGFLVLSTSILIISSQPILPSLERRTSQGVLIVGRYLDQAKLQAIAKRTELAFQLYQLNQPDFPQSLIPIVNYLKSSPGWKHFSTILTRPLNDFYIDGYTLISDIENQAQLLIQVNFSRDIYQKGKKSLNYLVLTLLVAGGCFGVIILLMLQKIILIRLETLSQKLREIGNTNNLSLRVVSQGHDELSSLAVSANWMLEKLETNSQELAIERDKTEKLLLNILPELIANRLKQEPSAIAESFEEVSILFADIVGFTPLSSRLLPIDLVNLLNQIFSEFDALADELGLEKIKTIGDAYMVVAGLPVPRADHAEAIAKMALLMQSTIHKLQQKQGEAIEVRIGINTGSVVAGVIGTKKFSYDLWGDAVNIASRMESSGIPGKIQVTETIYQRLKDLYQFEPRGLITVKGRGELMTYWLVG